MRNQPVRRGQVVNPFGVGGLMVMPDSTSLLGAGLDKWFIPEDGQTSESQLDISEFRVEEWRLQALLRVDYFNLPPDFRMKAPYEIQPNTGLTVPYLRFPQWHSCRRCSRLEERPLSEHGRIQCSECNQKGFRSYLNQVRFVAMCDYGHLQDFPWREWAHRTATPDCKHTLRLISTGSATLAGQRVGCDCGIKPRTLTAITTAEAGGATSVLSNTLAGDRLPFLCRGKTPWHGTSEGSKCDRPLRGTLRSASNLYYSLIKSAIYLPRGGNETPSELITLLEEPPLSTVLLLLERAGGSDPATATLRSLQPELLKRFSDHQITEAVRLVKGGGSEIDETLESREEDLETRFRRPEFAALREARDENHLLIRETPIADYEPELGKWFQRITLIDKLRETRALAGFSRVFAEQGDLEERKALLRAKPPIPHENWLPAYVVHGEGIFLELNESALSEWERSKSAVDRVSSLIRRYSDAQRERRLRDRPLSPRFVLIHTLSHLLMNQLTFECGYGSSALRERLYVSNDPVSPMAGLLIYTAAGDSEGTMGGLVRMGRPGYLERSVRQALEKARWCSADPVCLEAGEKHGQGPDSCNLAACHNCSLVPETACEEFNRFLDRGLVVGRPTEPALGFVMGATHGAAVS